MLSTRANSFLATLERRPSIPTTEVEVIIKDQGFPCFSHWLNFHDQYAGYVDEFGQDYAIWGLIHENPEWLLPYRADIDREPHEKTFYITCADAHPSYTYQLDNKGEFLGFPAETFETHVERIALGWAFSQSGTTRPIMMSELRSSYIQEIFITQVKSHLISEASDKYSRYYVNDEYLFVENTETGTLRRGSQRT